MLERTEVSAMGTFPSILFAENGVYALAPFKWEFFTNMRDRHRIPSC